MQWDPDLADNAFPDIAAVADPSITKAPSDGLGSTGGRATRSRTKRVAVRGKSVFFDDDDDGDAELVASNSDAAKPSTEPRGDEEDQAAKPPMTPKTPKKGSKELPPGAPKTPTAQKLTVAVPKTPLSSRLPVSQLNIVIGNVKAALLKLTEAEGLDGENTEDSKTFTELQANQLIKWIFVEFCSVKGLRRALSLADDVRATVDGDGADLGAAHRAELVSSAESTPDVAKAYFRSLSIVLRYNDKPECPSYSQFMNNASRYDLRVHYRQCIQAMDTSGDNSAFDPEFHNAVVKCFLENNATGTSGAKHETMVRFWLSYKVGVDLGVMKNILERSAALEDLIDTFGKGIVPLLYPEFNTV